MICSIDTDLVILGGSCSAEEHAIEAPRSFFHIHNPTDTHCLARAVVVGLEWFETVAPQATRTPPFPDEFMRIRHDVHNVQSQRAKILMQRSGLQQNKSLYNLADVAKIQHLLNVIANVGKYRIIVFHKEQLYKVVYRGADRPAKYELCLVLASGHYGFITEPHQLFQVTHKPQQ